MGVNIHGLPQVPRTHTVPSQQPSIVVALPDVRGGGILKMVGTGSRTADGAEEQS